MQAGHFLHQASLRTHLNMPNTPITNNRGNEPLDMPFMCNGPFIKTWGWGADGYTCGLVTMLKAAVTGHDAEIVCCMQSLQLRTQGRSCYWIEDLVFHLCRHGSFEHQYVRVHFDSQVIMHSSNRWTPDVAVQRSHSLGHSRQYP